MAFKPIKKVTAQISLSKLGKKFQTYEVFRSTYIFSETGRWLQMVSKTLTKDLLSKNECFISVEHGLKLKILSA